MPQNIIDDFFLHYIKKPILKKDITINSYDEYIKNNNMFSLYFYSIRIPSSNKSAYGGVIYKTDNISPQHIEFDSYYKYMEKSTNIEAGYEGLLSGLEKVLSLNIKNLKIFGDSTIIPQKNKKKYDGLAILLNQFNHIEFNHVNEKKNIRARELANEALNCQSSK